MDTDTQAHLNMHAYMHAYIRTHVHTIVCINTCTHSYTHAQVTKSCSPINPSGIGEIPVSSICSDTIF